MRTKAVISERQAKRLKFAQSQKHGKALFDLSVRYCYDVRMTYGNDRIDHVKAYDKEWREYCFVNRNKILDLNPDGFINFAKNKEAVKEQQQMLKIYFEPDTVTRMKNIFSKY